MTDQSKSREQKLVEFEKAIASSDGEREWRRNGGDA